LSEQADCRLSLPKDIEWKLFDKYGLSLFLGLFSLILHPLSQKDSNLCAHALKTRAALVQRNQPSPIQQKPLSELQLFVKRARKTLVDPILAHSQQISSPEPSSSEDEADEIDIDVVEIPTVLQPPPEDTTLPENPREDLKSKRKTKGPKPKPETYKQSWSVSEQNLLEQLLEEIPDREKFRHAFFFLYPLIRGC
jgi:hypothetical protein